MATAFKLPETIEMPVARSVAARPLRIALFSGNYNYVRDGANQALNRLVAYFEAQGHKVRVYSPTSPTPAFPPAGTLISVPSISFPGRGDYRLARGLPESLKRDIRAFAPDIFHLSAPDPLGHSAKKLARAMGVPVVASVHTRFETYLEYYGLGWVRPMGEALLRRFYAGLDEVFVTSARLWRCAARAAADRHTARCGAAASTSCASRRQNARWHGGASSALAMTRS